MPVHDATHLSTTHYEALRTRRTGKLAAGILIKCKEEIFYKSYITHWGLLDISVVNNVDLVFVHKLGVAVLIHFPGIGLFAFYLLLFRRYLRDQTVRFG